MRSQLRLLVWSILIILHTTAMANDERCASGNGLVFDDHLPDSDQFVFEDQLPGYPKVSDFKIIRFQPMSNPCGDRWALVTLKNISPGTSSIENDHLIALLADGQKRKAKNLDQRVAGNEQISLSVYFGRSTFPIIKVMTKGR